MSGDVNNLTRLEKASFGSQITNASLMAMLLLLFKIIAASIIGYKAMLLAILTTEFTNCVLAYKVARAAEDAKKAELWGAFIISLLSLSVVGLVVIAGSMLELAFMTAVGAFGFVGLCLAKTAYHLGSMLYFGAACLLQPDDPRSEERFDKFCGHGVGFVLSALITLAILFGLASLPYSAPVVLTIVGAIVLTKILYDVGFFGFVDRGLGKAIGYEKPCEAALQYVSDKLGLSSVWTKFKTFFVRPPKTSIDYTTVAADDDVVEISGSKSQQSQYSNNALIAAVNFQSSKTDEEQQPLLTATTKNKSSTSSSVSSLLFKGAADNADNADTADNVGKDNLTVDGLTPLRTRSG